MAAPKPAVSDFVRIKATASLGGQTAVWGCDFRISAVGGAGLTLQQIADKTALIHDVEIPPCVGNGVLIGSPILELVSPTTGRVLQSTVGASAHPAGAGGATTLPKQVAAVIRKVTGLAGPRNRGRVYWPFLPSGFITTAGTITPGARTALDAASVFMFLAQTPTVGADSNILLPVLIHRYTVPAVPSFVDITDLLTTLKLGTQRKRGDYGKPNPPI